MHVAPVSLIDETSGKNADWGMVDLPTKKFV